MVWAVLFLAKYWSEKFSQIWMLSPAWKRFDCSCYVMWERFSRILSKMTASLWTLVQRIGRCFETNSLLRQLEILVFFSPWHRDPYSNPPASRREDSLAARFATFLCTGQIIYEFGSRGACSKAALIVGSFRDWLGLCCSGSLPDVDTNVFGH